MKILFCGSRDFKNKEVIRNVISNLPKDTIVIHGCANGADTIAGDIAKEYNLKVLEFPADWNKYGKGAGPIRNKQMLDEGKPDLIYAFFTSKIFSKGTRNMINQAKEYNIKVIEYEEMKFEVGSW